uniref:Transcription factor CBF/NF-Y/archaeal histone domain-containing protein n=1 Tax=Panagrolaimus sp. ES5 TaxID=591445 RepID=A0AC34F0Q1_9BILA
MATKDYKKDKPKKQKNVNSSTLSLHIAAYENSVKASNDTSDNENTDEREALKKKDKMQIFLGSSSILQYSFEFPRQQENEQDTTTPEVVQFKASEKLINPNKAMPENSGVVNKEVAVKLIQSSFAGNSVESDAINRLFDTSVVMTEQVLDYAMEAAKQRNSDVIEKCDIELAITLIKQNI